MTTALLTSWILFVAACVSMGAALLWRDRQTFSRPIEPDMTGVAPENREKAIVFQILFGSLFFPFVIAYRTLASRGAQLIFIGWSALVTGGAALIVAWPFLLAGELSPLRVFGGNHGHIWATVAAAPFGALLFLIKNKQRFVYGAFEYVIGAAGFVFGVVSLGSSPAASLPATLSTAAGSYLMIEGIQNLKAGWPEMRSLANFLMSD